MDSIISTVYATSTHAIEGFITTTIVPLWIWLLGITVLMFVVAAVFGVFRRRKLHK